MKTLIHFSTILSFVILTFVAKSQSAIVSAEYYIDTDPGKGNATSVSLIGLPDLSFTYNHTSLTEGLHRIGLRTKDANGKWSMDAMWLFVKPSITSEGSIANIIRAEYYIDVDPGKGNATSIPLTNLPNLLFTYDFSSLNEGLHRIGIRTKDANGKWSIDAMWLFVKPPYPSQGSIANIVRAEYYTDADPGKGNATSISLTGLPHLFFNYDFSSLNEGLHRIGIRTKDANGKWSLDALWLFVKPPFPSQGSIENIVAAEYYIDTDPGKGNGISVPVSGLPNLSFTINYTNLSEGMHRIGTRSKDAEGKWSLDALWLFVKPTTAAHGAIEEVITAEYYIDTDPGKGNGNPIVFNDGTNLINILAVVNLSGLSNGMHKLGLRSKDAEGKWSLDAEYGINLSGSVPSPTIVVSSLKDDIICKGGLVEFAYDPNGTFNAGNIFTAQLSNINGSFASPTILGTKTSTTSGVFKVLLPDTLTLGSGYKLRVNSSNPMVTGQTSMQTITLFYAPYFPDTLFVSITDCPDGTTNLYNAYGQPLLDQSWNYPTPENAPAGIYTLIAHNLDGCLDTTIAKVTLDLNISTWVGTTNFDWHTSSNWSSGVVPDSTTHVIIPNVGNPCTIRFLDAHALSVQNFKINGLEVFENRNLFIYGNCGELP